MTLTIKDAVINVEVGAGEKLIDCLREAKMLARNTEIGATVRFSFNAVWFNIRVNTDLEKEEKRFWDVMKMLDPEKVR